MRDWLAVGLAFEEVEPWPVVRRCRHCGKSVETDAAPLSMGEFVLYTLSHECAEGGGRTFLEGETPHEVTTIWNATTYS